MALGLGAGWWLGSGAAGAGAASAEGAGGAPIRSVAVIPFVNLSDDPSNEYFSDGLAEELLNVLAQVEELKVAARTSSWAFKGEKADVKEIAAALGVQAVVEGSVRRQDDRVRVTAQLIHASDGFHLWSHTYDSRIDDVFALQDSLAGAIGEALQVTLGIADLSRRERGLTEDLAAYDLYLLGRHRWARRTVPAIREAIRYYEEAIALDSTFALAYSGLADAHLVLGFYEASSDVPASLARAEAAVAEALELSPELGEVQATAGLVAYHRWDLERSSRHLERALQLAPGYLWTHHNLRQLHMSLAQREASVAAARRAYEIDPLSPIVVQSLAGALEQADSLEAAVPYSQQAIVRPDAAYYWLSGHARLLDRLGRKDEAARAWVRQAEGMGYPDPERAAVMSTGDPAAVEAYLDDVVAKTPYSRADLAFHYFNAGPDAFIEAATEAVDTHHVWALWLNVDWFADALRHDPRYRALLERVGIPLPEPR